MAGDVPYRDLIDSNWPGTFWVHAFSSVLFGNRLWSWRAADYLIFALGAAFLIDLVRRTTGKSSAGFLLFLMPVLYAGLSEVVAGQQDMSAAHFLPAVLWFHVRAYERKDWRLQLGAGVFLGAATLIKPTAGALGVAMVAQAFLLGEPFRRVAAHAAAAAAAALATLAAGFGNLLWSGASARDILDSVWTYTVNVQYGVPISMEMIFFSIPSKGAWWIFLTLGSLAGAAWAFRRENRTIGTTAPAILWLVGVLSFFVQWKEWGYHFSMCFPGMVAFLAVGLAKAWEHPPRRWRCAAGLAVVLAFAGVRWTRNYHFILQKRHLEGFMDAEGLTVAEAVALARRMEREVPKERSALVLGSASSVNYLSSRAQPSRFYYFPMLQESVPPLPMADRWCDLWEADLRRSVPEWCLIPTDLQETWLNSEVRPARALSALLAQGYRRQETIGRYPGLILYIREGR